MEQSSSRSPVEDPDGVVRRRVDGDVVCSVVADLGEVAQLVIGVGADYTGDANRHVADADPVLGLAPLGLGEVQVGVEDVSGEKRQAAVKVRAFEVRTGGGGRHGTHSLLIRPVACDARCVATSSLSTRLIILYTVL